MVLGEELERAKNRGFRVRCELETLRIFQCQAESFAGGNSRWSSLRRATSSFLICVSH